MALKVLTAMLCVAVIGLVALPVAAADEQESATKVEEFITTDSGLKYRVLVEGQEGPQPKPNDRVTFHYAGWLEDGTKFDSTFDRNTPLKLKMNQWMLTGWKETLLLMTPGMKLLVIVPPELGYGVRGRPPKIPANATLTFEIELISIKTGPKLPEFSKGNPEAQKTTESGLIYEPLKKSAGELPKDGEMVKINFAFWDEEGKLLDCSEHHGMEMRFPLGKHGYKIFNEGVAMLEVGSRYRFIVPPDLAFGSRGAGALVPPNATTIWELELVKILRPVPEPEFKPSPADKLVTLESGLQYEVLAEGTGKSPIMGDMVVVNYAGWFEDGTCFDSSFKKGDAASFELGRVVAGWNEGLQLMKEGAIYKFTIPPELAYGKRGQGQLIPPDATLIFYVELVEVDS